LPAAAADLGAPLSTVGLDSLAAVDLRNGLAAALGLPTLPASLAYDFSTAGAVLNHVVGLVGGRSEGVEEVVGGALEEGVVVAETVETEGVVVVKGEGTISGGRGEVVVEAALFMGAERAGISKCASSAVAQVSGRSVYFHLCCQISTGERWVSHACENAV
jgi:hypothetical protein